MTKSFIHKNRYCRPALIILLFALLLPIFSLAQQKKKVDILHSDLGSYDQRIVANAQRLIGHVNISIDGALIWCDSLYLYDNNTVDAFSNVHIVRGDTLNMYADFIKYIGDTKLAKARRNVRLIDKKMTLTTDSLDYNMNNDLASYNDWGTVKDSTNVLTSKIGLYYVNQKKAYFREKVDGKTKDYKIKSDTLIYFTDTKKVYLEGPTHIFNDKDTLYAEYGWYDSMTSYVRLTKKPRIWNKIQNVKADSIYYDKQNGEGLAMGHARIQDIENSIIVLGNQVKYNDLAKTASASDSAVFIQYSKTDSLFLHADRLLTLPDTTTTRSPNKETAKKEQPELASKSKIPVKETTDSVKTETPVPVKTTPTDTLKLASLPVDTLKSTTQAIDTLANKPPKNPRMVLAYHQVRFFREDFQGKCDSLVYWSKDSTIQLFTDPVIWSNKNQITADYIEIINRSKDRAEIHMKENAFIIAMEDDSIRFNQIKGKNMIGYVRQNNLYRINVDGNGQSNYYASDSKGIIGLNQAESSNITIYLDKGKVKKIAFIKSPDGELKPMADLEEGDKLLPGFNWQSNLRPVDKNDIFRKTPKPEKKAPKLKGPAIPSKSQSPVQ